MINIDYSNKFFQLIRLIIIFFGLKKIFHKIINVSSKNYEFKFSRIMLSKVKHNDIVWDIGANVGFYTKKFHKLIKINSRDKHLKKNGCIVAFEPDPHAIKKLKKKFYNKKNILLLRYALSDINNNSSEFTDDPSSPTNQLVDINKKDFSNQKTIKVRVAKADTLIKKLNLPTPNIIKIDVEGFEFEVLNGMKKILQQKTLREIFVEVHFAKLKKKKLKNAVFLICKILKDNKFSISWLDPSHLRAFRKN
jgi:FkbM family methyltransferase